VAQWVRSLDLRTKLQTWCTRLAAAIDKVYQLLAHSRWFSQDSGEEYLPEEGEEEEVEIAEAEEEKECLAEGEEEVEEDVENELGTGTRKKPLEIKQVI
jgi:hypothetical protein